MGEAFKLKRWEVSVPGYGTGIYCVPTRGKALADAWRCDAFSGVTFGEFIKFARARRATEPPRWGDQITVLGKPAFFVGENGQYVQFAWPDGEFVLNSHPFDVQPESYRPAAYRTPSQAASALLMDEPGGHLRREVEGWDG